MAFDPTAEHPRLLITRWREVERENGKFNCIAWAVNDRSKRWFPAARGYHWPPGASTLPIRASFAAVFAQHGYEPCKDGNFEPGLEKIALYELNGVVKHAARQMPDGKWTSKLGDKQLIEHELRGLEDQVYGYVTAYFQRPVKADKKPEDKKPEDKKPGDKKPGDKKPEKPVEKPEETKAADKKPADKKPADNTTTKGTQK